MRRALDRLFYSIRDRAIRRAFNGPTLGVGGIPLAVAFVPKAERRSYAEKVAKALGIITQFDPVRRARIGRDVAGILVWPFVPPGAAAEFISDRRLCVLDAAFVRKQQAMFIALTIIHEATHARLARYDYATHAARLERLCGEAELAFAMRLPNAEAFQDHTRQVITRHASFDHSKRGQLERGVAHLQAEGASPLLVAALSWLVRAFYGRSD